MENQVQTQTQVESKFKWYVLNVASHKEKSVKEKILKQISLEKLENFVINVEIPTEKQLVIKNGKKSVKEKILMPGYVLIEADITHGEVQPMIKSVPNVFGFLSTREGKVTPVPIPLRDSEVDSFLQRNEETNEIEVTWDYVEGDSVKILDGPFQNFDGHITKVDNSKKMLKVTVNIFSRQTPVEVNFTQVEKL